MYKKLPKFKAQKVERDGHWFASKLELSVYGLIKQRELAGELKLIQCQKRVKFWTYKFGEIIMIPDFFVKCSKTGEEFFIEAKGFETTEWKRKRKAWIQGGPGKMEIWKGTAARPKLAETLIPESFEKID